MYDVLIFFTDYCFGFLRYTPRTHAHKHTLSGNGLAEQVYVIKITNIVIQ